MTAKATGRGAPAASWPRSRTDGDRPDGAQGGQPRRRAIARQAKVIALRRARHSAVTLRGLGVTKGARAAIEAAGGTVED
ncbi:MAG: uL15 family ribosomal protein [Chromatiales bacterium]|nr:uL15 family ribosomal protein [Chromatiales bacterium]